MKGLDSAARFSAAAAKAAGYDIGCRYINQTFTASELADYQANGLIFLPIYEESGKPGNFADGARQGANALRLLTTLGIPTYGCAFTDDVSGAPYSVVREWVRGIKSTFPNHIVYYGPSDKGDQLVDEGLERPAAASLLRLLLLEQVVLPTHVLHYVKCCWDDRGVLQLLQERFVC